MRTRVGGHALFCSMKCNRKYVAQQAQGMRDAQSTPEAKAAIEALHRSIDKGGD